MMIEMMMMIIVLMMMMMMIMIVYDDAHVCMYVHCAQMNRGMITV